MVGPISAIHNIGRPMDCRESRSVLRIIYSKVKISDFFFLAKADSLHQNKKGIEKKRKENSCLSSLI
jgi:hypothetical protein